MTTMMKRLSLALLLAAVAPLVFAQQPPPATRGFSPDKVYAAGPIDSVNEFNGNLIATIPLGETYAVSPSLSYSFKATHNGKTWDYIQRQIILSTTCSPPQLEDCTTNWTDMEAIPDGTANAGFGWRVQFMRFISSGDLQAHMDRPLVETPDGAQHGMYVSLHDGDTEDGAGYTRDASYLRIRGNVVDTPDGLTYELTNNKVTRIHDQVKDGSGNYVNHVDVQYGSLPGDAPWPCTYPAISQKITDTKGRISYLCFQSMNYDGTNRPTVTDLYVGTPAGSGHYTFNQVQTVFGRENFDKGYQYLYLPANTTVPALMSITMPDGTSYGFQYFGTYAHPGFATGNFHSITLPTKGSYKYEYGYYQIPMSYDCTLYEEWLANSYSPGITTREQLDAGGTVVGRTRYGSSGPTGGVDGGSYQCTTEQEGPGYFTAFAPGAELANSVIPGDNHSYTVHYYSVWPGYNRLLVDSPDGFKRVEYGLPFTRNASKMRDGLFLSAETYLCTDAYNAQCSSTPIRATYVQYEVDALTSDPTTFDHNARLKKSETVYFDDIDPNTDAPATTISTVSNDDFDGLGHYRVTETAGFGSTRKRRTTTDFNPTSGTYPGTHSKPATSSPWLLNLFTYQETKDIDVSSGNTVASAKAEVCFDGNNGFLKRKRTIAGGSFDPTHDLLTVFEPNGNGEVAAEAYYGGDLVPLASGFDTCNSTPTSPQYRITHDFASGVMTRSQYDGMTFNSYDVDVYPSTSAISTSRDSAQIPATFVYDALGRITEVHPQGTGWTEYEYTIPASGAPSVAVRQRPEGTPKTTAAIAEQRYYFDGLGRLIQQKSAMPSLPNGTQQWATLNRTYDFMGRLSREYVAYTSTAPDFDMSFTPSYYTEYTYDDLGRNTIVKAPDGKQTTTAYFAASQQRKTSGVATGVSAETSQTTRYIYDYLGRLTTVKEKNNTITAGYSYDIANRLSNVQMTGPEGTQSRSFTYDNRGFLDSEVHPENGTTTFPQYDARGHAWQKRTAGDSAFDLNMTFDGAERLTLIESRNPYYAGQWRTSKVFSFATANGTSSDGSTNYMKGKLSSAKRHNYQPILGDILITETLEYNNAGRVSKKTTTAAEHSVTSNTDTTLQSFEQKFTYDQLGNVLKAGYPACQTAYCGGSPLADFEYGYDKGYLTSVPGFIDSITYYPSGLMNQLNHSSGVTTQQTQDDSGMPRVKNITVSNYGNCAVPIPVINGEPGDITINSGSTTTLTVYAAGSSMTYQWYNATTGQSIPGATSSSYTTPALTQTTSYYVIISTPCGSKPSRTAVVTVCTAPNIDGQPGDITINANTATTLTVHATGTGLTYQWYNVTTGQSIPGATSTSYTTPQLTQTTLYYVVVSSSCGATPATSRVATVTVCTPPSLSSQPPLTVVVYGNTTTLVASATGTSLHYHWYAGFAVDTSSPVGTDSPFFTTPAVTGTLRYWVQVTNSCGTANGSTLTVVPVSAPASATATFSDATHVLVQWPAATNAVQYRIMRRETGTTLRAVATVSSSVVSTLDAVPANLEFLYCVQALDSAGAATPCSMADFASTRTWAAIAAGQVISASHYQQILDGINALYDISGAAHVAWSNVLPQGVPAPAAGGVIVAQHVASLRNAVVAARNQVAQSNGVSIPGLTFTDPQLSAGTLVRAVHLQQLQGGLQ